MQPTRYSVTRTTPARTLATRNSASQAADNLFGGGVSNPSDTVTGFGGTGLSYTNPINSLRTGGDVTNINAFGDGTEEENIQKMAGSLYESQAAKLLAMTRGADYQFGGGLQRDAFQSMFGKPLTSQSYSDVLGGMGYKATNDSQQYDLNNANSWVNKFGGGGKAMTQSPSFLGGQSYYKQPAYRV